MQSSSMLVCIFIFFSGPQANQVSSYILSPTQQCILKDFSWKVKLQFLNDLSPQRISRRGPVIQPLVYSNTTQNHLIHDGFKQTNLDEKSLQLRRHNVQLAKALKRKVAIDFLVKGPIYRKKSPRIDNESSMSLEETSDLKNLDFEAMGVNNGLQTNHNTVKNFKKKKMLHRRDELRTNHNTNKKNMLHRRDGLRTNLNTLKNNNKKNMLHRRDGLRTNHNTLKNNNKKIMLHRRQGDAPSEAVSPNVNEAENERDMKLKVFRLMYDTVKDNDELVRKADVIKKQYDNSSFFEIGFIMGAITDKVNTMSEVALTVERLFDDWKPIEHVNAYEQIANQAIEINHLVDILKSAHKKVEVLTKKVEKPQALRQELKNLNEWKDLQDLQLRNGDQMQSRNLDRTI